MLLNSVENFEKNSKRKNTLGKSPIENGQNRNDAEKNTVAMSAIVAHFQCTKCSSKVKRRAIVDLATVFDERVIWRGAKRAVRSRVELNNQLTNNGQYLFPLSFFLRRLWKNQTWKSANEFLLGPVIIC